MISYFEQQLHEIDQAVRSLDTVLFQKWVDDAAHIIDSGHKIVVSGLGKNVPICEKFVGSMVSMGMEAAFLHTNSAVHGDMGIVKDGDMVVILSKTGETQESIYLSRLLTQRKIELWLLSFEIDSTLSREIPNHIILNLNHEGDQWNIMPNNSTTVNLIVLQGLAMQIAVRRGVQLEDFRRNHPGGHIGTILNGEKKSGEYK